METHVRSAVVSDRQAIRRIYNQGIAERCTLETRERTDADIALWLSDHDERHAVLVAERDGAVAG